MPLVSADGCSKGKTHAKIAIFVPLALRSQGIFFPSLQPRSKTPSNKRMGRNFLNILSLILAFVAVIALMVYGMRRLATFFIEPKFAQNQRYVYVEPTKLNTALCERCYSPLVGEGDSAVLCSTYNLTAYETNNQRSHRRPLR